MHAVDTEGGTAPLTIGYDRPEQVLRAVTNTLNLGRNGLAGRILRDVLDGGAAPAKAHALLGVVHERAGDMATALPLFERAIEMDPTDLELHSAYVFALDQAPDVTLEQAYRARRRVNDVLRVDHVAPHPNDRDPERRIRLGYVSNDFKNHSAAFGWAPVVLLHDREQFDLYAYSCTPGTDWATDDLRASVPNWRDCAYWNDDRLEAQVREDGIDILVDLSGHSSGHRLAVFARKPAPVQVTGWGYITGTGLDAMDYLFADEDTVRPDEERWYAEEVVRLPRILTFWAPTIDEPGPLPAETNSYLTFGVFNRLGKIQPPCASAWSEILRQLPTARLLVKSPGLEDADARVGLERMFAEAGCDLSRLEFRGTTTKNVHLRTYDLVDVALDPSPHGGGMSTLEAAWMGVPSVTLPHAQIPSRIATTVNRELGLSWAVAESWDDYVRRAVAVDGQRAELARVRRLLREMMRVSAFGNHGLYTRSVEAVYRDLWRRWCVGEEPKKPELRVVGD